MTQDPAVDDLLRFEVNAPPGYRTLCELSNGTSLIANKQLWLRQWCGKYPQKLSLPRACVRIETSTLISGTHSPNCKMKPLLRRLEHPALGWHPTLDPTRLCALKSPPETGSSPSKEDHH
eukprot:365278-Chlamydomonas_euryale.AAC.2